MVDEERLAQLVRQAWKDKALQATLLNDPTPYLKNHGIAIPDGLTARLQVEKDTVTLRLEPARPANGARSCLRETLTRCCATAACFALRSACAVSKSALLTACTASCCFARLNVTSASEAAASS